MKSGQIGGCFFFNKNAGDATNTRLFCSTIAVQLGRHPFYWPQFRPSVVDGIKKLGPVSSFEDKFLNLVIQPVEKIPLVLVIDALDECNTNDRGTLLDCLLSYISRSPGLKVFITSRPEPDISRRLYIYQSHTDSLHRAEVQSNQDDIETFVRDQMNDLVSRSILSSEDVGVLCERVNGLFILASTSCRVVRNHPDPSAMLKTLLDTTNNLLTDVNQLYLKILENAYRLRGYTERSWAVIQRKMMQVLKFIVSAAKPLPLPCFEPILGINGIRQIIESLDSVLNVTADETVLILHPTFREFLVDQETANQFHINMEEAHGMTAKGCIRVLVSELKFNICRLNSSFLLNAQVRDLEDRISTLSQQVKYSAVHWPSHVVLSDDLTRDPGLVDAVLQILKCPYAFYWMEVLSALKQVPNAISGLEDIKNRLLVSLISAIYRISTVPNPLSRMGQQRMWYTMFGDFCSHFRRQYRIASPIFIFLLYLSLPPNLSSVTRVVFYFQICY
jgi:hypothetical protein